MAWSALTFATIMPAVAILLMHYTQLPDWRTVAWPFWFSTWLLRFGLSMLHLLLPLRAHRSWYLQCFAQGALCMTMLFLFVFKKETCYLYVSALTYGLTWILTSTQAQTVCTQLPIAIPWNIWFRSQRRPVKPTASNHDVERPAQDLPDKDNLSEQGLLKQQTTNQEPEQHPRVDDHTPEGPSYNFGQPVCDLLPGEDNASQQALASSPPNFQVEDGTDDHSLADKRVSMRSDISVFIEKLQDGETPPVAGLRTTCEAGPVPTNFGCAEDESALRPNCLVF